MNNPIDNNLSSHGLPVKICLTGLEKSL